MPSTDLFANPPAEFRPMPFWFWNTKLTADHLLGQVREMHEKGCGGFFIHARFGLETEYLGEDWLALIGKVCDLSRQLGMQVWLYDEESFPSGLVGGKITSNRDWRAKFVDVTEQRVCGPETVRLALPSSESDRAFAVPTESLSQWPQGRVDLTGSVRNHELVWEAPEGDWTVMVFSQCTLDSQYIVFGVDYTDRDAMQAFFNTTFDPYVEHLEKYFGRPIQGIFTDEPTLLPWHHDSNWYQERDHRRVTFWNASVEGALADSGHYPADVLAALFYDTGPQAAKLRRAYWEQVLELYEDVFFRPYRQWCDEHGLEFTGHLLLEEGLYNNTLFQADPTRTLRHMHRPGTDHLGLQPEQPYGGGHLHVVPTNLQGLKLVPSVASIVGQNRVMTESFGCGGWAMTLEQMKHIVDWQWSLGINFLCPHAVFGSIEGFRKTDAPPCPLHNTMWEHYSQLTDYVGRLSYLLCRGKPAPKVGLVYPLEPFQEVYEVGRDGGRARTVSDTFDHLCVALMRLHYNYDIVPRWALEQAHTDGGKLRVGQAQYEALIWPFAQEDDVHDRLSKQVTVFDVDETLGESRGEVIDSLARLIYDRLPPTADIRVEGAVYGAIYTLQRHLPDGDVYYFANVGQDAVEADIALPGQGPWQVWDCETGSARPLEAGSQADASTFRLPFAPYKTWVVTRGAVDDPELPQQPVLTVGEHLSRRIELPQPMRLDLLGHNCLPLNELRMRHSNTPAGQQWHYKVSFEAAYIPDDLVLVFDDIEYRNAAMRGLDLTIRLNDRLWHRPEMKPYLWPELKQLIIAPDAQEGSNDLEITIQHRAWQDEPKTLVHTPWLAGSFAVADGTISAPPTSAGIGPWEALGLARYSGACDYSTTITMPPDWSSGKAVLCAENVANILEVLVNGRSAGVRCWRPWHIDIGALLEPGDNSITLRVTNTIAPMLQGPAPSGLLGEAWIEI